MWEWMGNLCVAVLLAYHSVFDIKRQCIPRWSLSFGVALSCCYALGRGVQGAVPWAELGIALLPGTAALALAKITGEQIGRGDGWELILMGNWMGLANCLLALGIALLGIFLVSAILLLLGRVGRRTRIAFVPFLCTGTIAVLLRFWI